MVPVLASCVATTLLLSHPFAPPAAVDPDEPVIIEDEEPAVDPEHAASDEPVPVPEDAAQAPGSPDALHAADLVEMTGSTPAPAPIVPTEPYMRPEGVNDPFPDRVVTARPRDAALLLGVGFGLGIASVVTARLALLPDCRNESDVTTCTPPSGADIGVRAGRLVGSVAFAAGGATFAGFGARELGQVLQQRGTARGRRVAIGVGTSAMLVGAAGMVAGATIFGLAAHRSLALAGSFSTTMTSLSDADTARLRETIDQVRTARNGLMLMVGAPTLFATGVALLVHRPRLPRLSVSPIASRRMFGVSATVRF